MISHEEAAAIALRLYEDGVEGAAIIAEYVDQQSRPKPFADLSEREWADIAATRAGDAVAVVAKLRDRVDALERRVGL